MLLDAILITFIHLNMITTIYHFLLLLLLTIIVNINLYLVENNNSNVAARQVSIWANSDPPSMRLYCGRSLENFHDFEPDNVCELREDDNRIVLKKETDFSSEITLLKCEIDVAQFAGREPCLRKRLFRQNTHLWISISLRRSPFYVQARDIRSCLGDTPLNLVTLRIDPFYEKHEEQDKFIHLPLLDIRDSVVDGDYISIYPSEPASTPTPEPTPTPASKPTTTPAPTTAPSLSQSSLNSIKLEHLEFANLRLQMASANMLPVLYPNLITLTFSFRRASIRIGELIAEQDADDYYQRDYSKRRQASIFSPINFPRLILLAFNHSSMRLSSSSYLKFRHLHYPNDSFELRFQNCPDSRNDITLEHNSIDLTQLFTNGTGHRNTQINSSYHYNRLTRIYFGDSPLMGVDLGEALAMPNHLTRKGARKSDQQTIEIELNVINYELAYPGSINNLTGQWPNLFKFRHYNSSEEPIRYSDSTTYYYFDTSCDVREHICKAIKTQSNFRRHVIAVCRVCANAEVKNSPENCDSYVEISALSELHIRQLNCSYIPDFDQPKNRNSTSKPTGGIADVQTLANSRATIAVVIFILLLLIVIFFIIFVRTCRVKSPRRDSERKRAERASTEAFSLATSSIDVGAIQTDRSALFGQPSKRTSRYDALLSTSPRNSDGIIPKAKSDLDMFSPTRRSSMNRSGGQKVVSHTPITTRVTLSKSLKSKSKSKTKSKLKKESEIKPKSKMAKISRIV